MQLLAFLIVLAIGVAFVVKLKSSIAQPRESEQDAPAPTSGRKATGQFRARKPLSDYEQGMYHRLHQAFPEHIILAQVAFSALLQTSDRPTRSMFDRKYADFVVCSKAFEVLAVVELDDSSHKGREEPDAKRESLLWKAGYKILRYGKYPEVGQLQGDLASDDRRNVGVG
jgi:very-short-patch-repair endonuclease